MLLFMFFFFCKQKTAYEMRISDWSSDVCSSDLGARGRRRRNDRTFAQPEPQAQVPEHQPQTQQEIAEPPVEDVAVEQPEQQTRRQRNGPAIKRPEQENDPAEPHQQEQTRKQPGRGQRPQQAQPRTSRSSAGKDRVRRRES